MQVTSVMSKTVHPLKCDPHIAKPSLYIAPLFFVSTCSHSSETAHSTCGVRFRVLTQHLAASPGDQQRRLDAQKVHSHLFEELDPREENLRALVLLPLLIQASAQGAHLGRSTERYHSCPDLCGKDRSKNLERMPGMSYLGNSHPLGAQVEDRWGCGGIVSRKLEVEHQRR